MPAPPRAFFLYGTIAHYRVRGGQLPGRQIGYLPTSLQILFGSRLQVYIATWLHDYANTLEREKPFTLLIILLILIQIPVGSYRATRLQLHTYRATPLQAYAATRLRTDLAKERRRPKRRPL